MGYEFNHHPKIQDQKTNVFLPMFCRLSIKDINLNNHYQNPISGHEPSSPKVSCIGQVRRDNRVTGFPSADAGHHRHSNIKKLFPAKTFLPTTAEVACANHHKHKKLVPGKTFLPNIAGYGAGGGRSGIHRSCRASRQIIVNNSGRLRMKRDQDCSKVVDISEMDPPLPVVKRVAPPGVGRDEVNIWKRRFNGVGLKSLQIERIHSPNYRKFEVCMRND